MESRSRTGSSPRPGGDQRLRKSDRLRKRREFLRVQRRGRKVHLRDLLVLVREGPRRFGVTVTRKVGCAVQRNRIKRLVREVWRRDKARLPQDMEMVFVAKKSAATMTYGQLRRQFDQLVRKLAGGADGAPRRR